MHSSRQPGGFEKGLSVLFYTAPSERARKKLLVPVIIVNHQDFGISASS
jgi:hypothetical protein